MSDVAPGASFGGRWIVERPLSSGGMGAVYVAKHGDTGRQVALKVIKSPDAANDKELVSRFRKETTALAAISHPNVVTFLDSGLEGTTIYLVMELLAGKPLRSIMSAPVEWRRAYKIGADVCRALAAVHAQGIVHRDLKPENVFLVDAVGHDEIAKLIDFGIARLADSAVGTGGRTQATATQTGAVVGTPGYISPEQLRGEQATVASDVYAVGVMLYELVTGRFPFEAPSTHAMLVKQLFEPLPPPRSLQPSVPQHVEDLIVRFMERDPLKRVRTSTDALAQLVDNLGRNATRSLAPEAATEAGTRVGELAASITAPPVHAPPSAPPSVPTSATPSRVAPPSPPSPSSPSRSRVPIAIGAGALLVVVVVVVVAVVAGGGRRGGGGGGGGGAGAGQKHRDRFVGEWIGTYGGTYTLVNAPGGSYSDSGTMTVTETGNDLFMQVVSDARNHATCSGMYAKAGPNMAATSPKVQACTFTRADDGRQTNLGGSRAVVHDDGTMTIDADGTMSGVVGVFPFQGTYRGTWTFRRR